MSTAISQDELERILAPYVAPTTPTPARQIKHLFLGTEVVVAKELGIQCKTICGKHWGWPKGGWITPPQAASEADRCEECMEGFIRSARDWA